MSSLAAASVAHERAARTSTHGPAEIFARAKAAVGGVVPLVILLAGLAAVAFPTLAFVARETWSTEQGAHGPIVLFTGLWLISRGWAAAGPALGPSTWRVGALLVPLLVLFLVARISQIIEVEGFLMYAVVVTVLYAFVGGTVVRNLAFPLIYLAFIFPPPETLVYAVTLPLKVVITETAVGLLRTFGYPIGYTGVSIQIGQYQLLVAAACSGLNSIISLSVLSTFYVYIRHGWKGQRAYWLLALVLPVALLANFVRVMVLILLTYHLGEAAAQGFLHNFAGLTMFAAALLTLFAADALLDRVEARHDAPVRPVETTPTGEGVP